eukprot:2035523-Pyramimonas_sp.AAC.1
MEPLWRKYAAESASSGMPGSPRANGRLRVSQLCLLRCVSAKTAQAISLKVFTESSIYSIH